MCNRDELMSFPWCPPIFQAMIQPREIINAPTFHCHAKNFAKRKFLDLGPVQAASAHIQYCTLVVILQSEFFRWSAYVFKLALKLVIKELMKQWVGHQPRYFIPCS